MLGDDVPPLRSFDPELLTRRYATVSPSRTIDVLARLLVARALVREWRGDGDAAGESLAAAARLVETFLAEATA